MAHATGENAVSGFLKDFLGVGTARATAAWLFFLNLVVLPTGLLRRQATANLCRMAGFRPIEACASGRPVVAYGVERHYELIQDGETGYLVAENDIDEVTEIITGICAEPESKQLERLGRAARVRAFARHDLSVTSAIKNRLYVDLLRA